MVKKETSLIKFEIGESDVYSSGKILPQEIEVEILPLVDDDDPRKAEIRRGIAEADNQLDFITSRIDELNSEIDSLTNHADGIDYAVAVASGILTGVLDSLFVGDFNPSIEEIVEDFANKKCKSSKKNYQDALQDKYHTKHDGAYKSGKDIFGKSHHVNGHTHRLDDFTHHPTLLGLVACILVKFLRVNVLFNKSGEGHVVKVPTDFKDILKAWGPAVLSGVLTWLANVAENYAEEELDTEIPEPIRKLVKLIAATPVIIEVLKCADEWYGHIMSDVATSKGIPGIFLSFLKEISALPILNKTGLPQVVQDMYNSKKFNFDSDLVRLEKLKKQAIPVIANEAIVRGFYFVRRLISELKENKSFEKIDWKKTIPFGNRTVERMMTIASGTFVAFDVADAAIRSGGFNAACVMRLNFVGIGRFAIAIGTDMYLGVKKTKKENERMMLRGQQLVLMNAKVFYNQAGMWIEAQNTEISLQEVAAAMRVSFSELGNLWMEIEESSKANQKYLENIRQNNESFANELLDILEWGV